MTHYPALSVLVALFCYLDLALTLAPSLGALAYRYPPLFIPMVGNSCG